MRIRTIKPEFYRSNDVTALSREDRLLFIGLWSYVDDNGVGIDDHRQIAADLFALEDDPQEIRGYVRDGLATLARGLLITRYEVGQKAYIYVTGWDRHQRVDRPNQQRYPRPTSSPTSHDDTALPAPASDSRVTPDIPAAVTEEQGIKRLRSKAAKAAETDARFDEFWAAYPRRTKKLDARKAWRTAVLADKADPDRVIAAARRHADRWRAEGKEIQYVPYPSSWLRGGSYDDEPETLLTLVPPALVLASFEDFRLNTAGVEAARLLGVAYLPTEQPPSDPTPPRQWQADQAVAWVDAHETELRAVLAERRTG